MNVSTSKLRATIRREILTRAKNPTFVAEGAPSPRGLPARDRMLPGVDLGYTPDGRLVELKTNLSWFFPAVGDFYASAFSQPDDALAEIASRLGVPIDEVQSVYRELWRAFSKIAEKEFKKRVANAIDFGMAGLFMEVIAHTRAQFEQRILGQIGPTQRLVDEIQDVEVSWLNRRYPTIESRAKFQWTPGHKRFLRERYVEISDRWSDAAELLPALKKHGDWLKRLHGAFPELLLDLLERLAYPSNSLIEEVESRNNLSDKEKRRLQKIYDHRWIPSDLAVEQAARDCGAPADLYTPRRLHTLVSEARRSTRRGMPIQSLKRENGDRFSKKGP